MGGGEGEKKGRAEGVAVAEKVCKRCKALYQPSSNTASSCRFHPSFFVSRRHDDQKRCDHSVPSLACELPPYHEKRVSLTYYELGPDDPPYAAKFYDCCGAEDPDALGCATNFHVSYDDE